MYKFIKNYNNPEKFNEEFIYMKKNEDLLGYVNNIAKALEVVKGITFLGGSLNTNESTFKAKGTETEKWISIEESRLNAITLKFKIEGTFKKKYKSEIVEKTFFFPKLINDFYFILNGSRYYPIYQIVDVATYHALKSLTLKTLLMHIVIKVNNFEFCDINENLYKSRIFILDLFKYRINIMHYYLAQFGIEDLITYFGYNENDIGFACEDEIDTSNEDYIFFNLDNSMYMYASKEMMEDKFGVEFAGSLIDMCVQYKTTYTQLYNISYWKKKLGIIFTKNINSQMEKADKILLSFLRILDDGTKIILQVDDEDKKDTFSITKWMIRNYDELCKKDNMDLLNKRCRLMEYLLYPLVIRFSNSTYRLLNSKNVTFSNIKSIFNTMSPGFIIKKLIKNELLRYHNAVNAIDLFTSALKFSFRGPQSLSDGGRSVNTRYRGLHPSYIGRIGLTASSVSDPGLSGTFSPFIKTNGLYFAPKDKDEGNEKSNEENNL